MAKNSEYNLENLPKEGSKEVGEYFWGLWKQAVAEKERLGVSERMMTYYRMFRGDHWDEKNVHKRFAARVTANLLFANIQRTVANITAKAPVANVVDMDGEGGDDADALTLQVKKWTNESESAKSLSMSALAMETYGITIEKAVYNPDKERTEIIVVDGFAFAPAPGYYEFLNDCPYVCHAYPMPIEVVEKKFDVEGVVEGDEELKHLRITDREEVQIAPQGTRVGTQNYPGNYASVAHPAGNDSKNKPPALVVEIWVRDYSTEIITETVADEEGNTLEVKVEREKYPGGIRVVTLTNGGNLVLADRINPNINSEIPRELTANTYLYDHFPFYKANSYEDSFSIWGFAAAEQVGDINLKINEILTRLSAYLNRVVLPPLIVPQDTGITLSQINNKPGLVLQPVSAATASGIRYLQVPNLPHNFFDALQWYVDLFDRISQIEDADRGDAPPGVIAASAIAALQERGAVMMRAKIRAVDYLVRQRGRCAISNFQNFGQSITFIDVNGEQKPIQGLAFINRKFNYIVESGSTVAKTTLQTQEQAMQLYEAGAIDRRALLETLNFPGWKEVIERAGEGQVDQAIQILIAAGLDKEEAMALKQYVMEPQGGPGDTQQTGEKPKAGPEARPPAPRSEIA